MRTEKITPNIRVDDIGEARSFYTDFLGLRTEEFDLGWVARFTDPETGAHVQLVTGDRTAPVDSSMSIHVDDVDAGYDIPYPLTTEEWGVRRFFVRAPDGTVINLVQHRD